MCATDKLARLAETQTSIARFDTVWMWPRLSPSPPHLRRPSPRLRSYRRSGHVQLVLGERITNKRNKRISMQRSTVKIAQHKHQSSSEFCDAFSVVHGYKCIMQHASAHRTVLLCSSLISNDTASETIRFFSESRVRAEREGKVNPRQIKLENRTHAQS